MKFETSPGRFNSTNIKIVNTCVANVNSANSLSDEDERKFMELETDKTAGALWLFILETDMPHYLGFAKKHNYSYHHFENDYFVYCKWNNPLMENKIQPYATSISGAAVLILSSDASKVLLVYEYGKYKCVTGATDYRELIITTGIRELQEEVGLTIDSNFSPVVAGGWNLSNVKPSVGINDALFCYVVKVNDSSDIKLDISEIQEAKWFTIEFLLEGYDLMMQTDVLQKSKTPHSDYIVHEDVKISCVALLWLKNYLTGKTMPTLVQGENIIIF